MTYSINSSNCYSKKDLNLAERKARNVFGGYSLIRSLFRAAKLKKKMLSDDMSHTSSTMTYEEVYEAVEEVLSNIATEPYERVIHRSLIFADPRSMVQQWCACYNPDTGLLIYSKRVLAAHIFWRGIVEGTLSIEWVVYTALTIIGHERRHIHQDPEMLPQGGTVDMTYAQHQRQICEIDADTAGHLFAQQIMGI